MSLTDKTLLSTYKDILQLDNSNNGVTSAGNLVKDGEGNNTMLTLGKETQL